MPRMGLRGLEKQLSGVSRSYIQRLKNAEIPEDKIDVLKLSQVLKFTMASEEERLRLMHTPPLKSKWEKISSRPAPSKLFNLNQQFDELIEDFAESIVFTLATHKKGTTKQAVKDILGQKGLLALGKLINREILN